ncbi:hypothetical protein AtNW77_Chr4g0275511 [Arabidopsis thaliana]|uniref:Transmembrane protein n=4 Tax=Arabidopsis TaxID=3701 RepID=A0A654FLE5_ARATH|nr:uncharacterized protein AT4G03113 [Arabidopsis thaliana]KAG7614971.1 hypothetical protein ISN45_At04g003680 [Arabidopsis thaliana x Arabidopsis arenosa]KAG7619466.1 hypothetical protein ISN44_As04g003570 [Arabidopsis suecica]AEE82275.1 transmembrane protein [Arabidopsis thaliana]CAA0393398.1 unnamed protein product [Arabidopsis thaliana]VYS61682.1 unnamed protein product [Arabidopsis thaliana]|eukprot:NP_001118923.1 transmembrane protein [Arabidopsis thaliana]
MNKFRGLFVGNMRNLILWRWRKEQVGAARVFVFLVALAGQSVMLVFAPLFSLVFTSFAILVF